MKTKQPLGRSLITLLLSLPLFAGVTASVDNPVVYRGDPVILTLSAEGESIDFPPLTEIAGYPVEGVSTRRSVSIINGSTTRSVEQRLKFTPTADVTVPALDITVDGGVEHTLPVSVKVLKPEAAPADAAMQFEMKLDKTEAYVGEPVRLDLIFRMKPGTKIDDLRISEPSLEDFWIKPLNSKNATRAIDSDGYITQTFSYLLFAQKSGDLTIPATFAQVGTRQSGGGNGFFSDPFFANRLQYKKLYSNEAVLHARALPDGLELYGDFTLNARVDTQKVPVNKPVNLHIHIEGEGNVEDIPKFSPTIGNAIVYANDPKVENRLSGGRYLGTFDQTIAVIPDRNMTIPAMTLRYFDKTTQRVVTKQTSPFAIEVTGTPTKTAASVAAAPIETAPASTPQAAPPAGSDEFNPYQESAVFAAGAFTGAALLWLFGLWRQERPATPPKETPMALKIKKAADDKALFGLLLPHKGSTPAIDEALEQLEANLYSGASNRIDKKALAACFNGAGSEEVELL